MESLSRLACLYRCMKREFTASRFKSFYNPSAANRGYSTAKRPMWWGKTAAQVLADEPSGLSLEDTMLQQYVPDPVAYSNVPCTYRLVNVRDDDIKERWSWKEPPPPDLDDDEHEIRPPMEFGHIGLWRQSIRDTFNTAQYGVDTNEIFIVVVRKNRKSAEQGEIVSADQIDMSLEDIAARFADDVDKVRFDITLYRARRPRNEAGCIPNTLARYIPANAKGSDMRTNRESVDTEIANSNMPAEKVGSKIGPEDGSLPPGSPCHGATTFPRVSESNAFGGGAQDTSELELLHKTPDLQRRLHANVEDAIDDSPDVGEDADHLLAEYMMEDTEVLLAQYRKKKRSGSHAGDAQDLARCRVLADKLLELPDDLVLNQEARLEKTLADPPKMVKVKGGRKGGNKE
ncbi:hypothetical protein BAUCODRAFT_470341 [Baudoinia panamericana UAMH 10762]|uniref:Uncharacterized protein n=1 Tax=Baudoinia panamericana (strain UAMH 10762) TaxID=717646 RepID=M2MI34_BAUPA|nr:uncharacterized protein BAUCODRAFT_470341 [Baudoinia panamericana UAMH 10762]EMC96316.1 hypothetical protein BAUCODRAFT_470341 [Baudoinia panamericana UAMH 10762]